MSKETQVEIKLLETKAVPNAMYGVVYQQGTNGRKTIYTGLYRTANEALAAFAGGGYISVEVFEVSIKS